MDGFDFGAEATPDDAAGMNGHVEDDPDAGALGGFDIADSGAAPAAPEAASPPAAAGTSVPFGADFGGSVETPQSTRDAGSHSFADVPMGGSSFNPKLTEWEEKTAADRKERQDGATAKEAEMKAAAAAAIEEHKAARTKAIADKLAENKAAESAAADALAGETNPWNTIYGMVEENVGVAVHADNQKYHDMLLNLKEQGKDASTREGVPPV